MLLLLTTIGCLMCLYLYGDTITGIMFTLAVAITLFGVVS